MKNTAYGILLVASFALGVFGAFMVYIGIDMPVRGDAAMSNASAFGFISLIAACGGVVMTCAHAIQNSR
jgi:hypothetical protein